MKLKRIERNEAGNFEILDVIQRVNEVIDFLNNSFITNDPDTVYGSVCGSVSSISCDRLTPLVNETTLNHLSVLSEPAGIYNGIKCPECGDSYFEVGPSVSTCVYYPTIIKDGVNINPDRNESTTTYTCKSCGHVWSE